MLRSIIRVSVGIGLLYVKQSEYKSEDVLIVINNLRRLGNSDLLVSPVGLGCLQFSRGRGISGAMWPSLSRSEINAIVETSIRGGINWFDTAELYGWGESERALSQSIDDLKIKRDEIVIATKWWPVLRTSSSITTSIDTRLSALNTDKIDLYQIHNSFSFSSISSQMKEMAKLVDLGKVRYVGVSNFSARRMRKAHKELSKYGLTLVSNQVNYSLLKRQIERNGVIDTAKELGISLIAYSPLGRGLLTGKFHDNPDLINKRHIFRRYYASLNKGRLKKSSQVIEALKSIAKKYQVTPSQIALNWVINSNGSTIVTIPGATKVGQARDNAEAIKFELSEDDISYLNDVSSSF
ncbi:MAG: oxidoreductase [Thermodesulfobacteriota bacterium]|nr:MAG: oxidoreductase [Thermodesulfobacteriota bacterium]